MNFKITKKIKVILSISVMAILISGTVAFFISKDVKTNSFTAGDLSIKIEEPNYKEPDNWNGEKIVKDANVKNTNIMPELIRVAIEPRFQDANGNFYSGDISKIDFEYVNITTNKNDISKWIDGNDGYYYYTSILKEGETTSDIINSVTFNVSEDEKVKYNEKTLKAVVRAEAIFSETDAYKTQWNVSDSTVKEMLKELSEM